MPPPSSQTRVRPRSAACHGWAASRCGPCMLPAICAGPWWWTKLSPPSASSAAATTYSCSAVRGVVGACVGQQLRRPRRHGTRGDGRDRGRQRRAVRWSVLPELRGISVICLCLGAYRKTIFLVLHLKIKLFPMFSITIDLVGKYRTQATARRRSRERTLTWTNWLVQ